MSIVLGCDVSTKRVALADNEGKTGSILLEPSDKGSQRLADAFHRVGVFTYQFLNERVPDVVWVEQPSGRHVHPALWQMYGVVRASLWWALKNASAYPVSVLAVTPGEWKKTALGDGAAKISEYVAFAQERTRPGNEDECAAYCIAVAGRAMTGTVA